MPSVGEKLQSKCPAFCINSADYRRKPKKAIYNANYLPFLNILKWRRLIENERWPIRITSDSVKRYFDGCWWHNNVEWGCACSCSCDRGLVRWSRYVIYVCALCMP